MSNHYTVNITSYIWNHGKYNNSDEYVNEILNGIDTSGDFVLVTNLLWEHHLMRRIDLFQNIFASLNKRKIKNILLANSYFRKYNLSETLDTKVYYIDYFLWRTYDKIVLQKKSKTNVKWNSEADKFLLLTGKPNRPHRLRLLWKLSNFLNKAIWSLHVNDSIKNECRKLIPELDKTQFEDFITKNTNNPDKIQVTYQEQSLHYGGIPYDEKIFAQSLFRIISETNFNENDNPWITEKTWLTILNKVPFILAGDQGSLDKLKSLGFKTFEEYLPVKNYDTINGKEEKLHAIIQNCEHWLENMIDKEKINADVEYNYKRLVELASNNKTYLEKICSDYQIDQLEDICSTKDLITKF